MIMLKHTLDNVTWCDVCENETKRRNITSVVVYTPDRNMIDVCKSCYKKQLTENKHVHPDNRL